MSDFLDRRPDPLKEDTNFLKRDPMDEPHLLQRDPEHFDNRRLEDSTLNQQSRTLKRDHDSTDDFEHLEHELEMQNNLNNQQHNYQQAPLLDLTMALSDTYADHEQNNLIDDFGGKNLLDSSIPQNDDLDLKPTMATPPPSADSDKFDSRALDMNQFDSMMRNSKIAEMVELDDADNDANRRVKDPKAATLAFMESEKMSIFNKNDHHDEPEFDYKSEESSPISVRSQKANNLLEEAEFFAKEETSSIKEWEAATALHPAKVEPHGIIDVDKDDFVKDIKSTTFPEPERSPELDFLRDEIVVQEATREKAPKPAESELWNVLEKSSNDKFEVKEVLEDEPPTKPLPPLPKGAEEDDIFESFNKQNTNKRDPYEVSNDFLMAESGKSKAPQSGTDTGDSEFESEPEPSPAKTAPKLPPSRTTEFDDLPGKRVACQKPVDNTKKVQEIKPSDIFKNIGLDAWFNPERLNPKVASLIYWRDPKKSGVVFGATLGVLLSLAYFSFISVVAYVSLLTLCFTISFRIYKTVLQAVQKTSEGHPFKDILEIDLNLPSEKVHQFADIAVNNANLAVSELRRLFLVEDFIDSLKFGVILWSLTYLGSWFNGMTLIILGVVALFTLPKVYETNKTQIDKNLAMVQEKINDITSKVKAAVPIGKKEESKQE